MKKLLSILFLVSLSLPALAADKESAYDRVIRTGVLRCGYIVWPPFMEQKADGSFTGINHDYTEAVGAALGLKIEWAQEVMLGAQIESLRSGKIDAICTAEGPIVPSTIKYLHYSTPFAYFPFYLYARKDDARFQKNADAVNSPDTRIATIDGDISAQLAAIQFPRAVPYGMPQLAAPAQMMLDVADKKADIVINDPLSMKEYSASNPGIMAQVPTGGPIAVIPNTISVLRGDASQSLLELINQGIENIKYTGREKVIFARYMKPEDQMMYTTALPYQVR